MPSRNDTPPPMIPAGVEQQTRVEPVAAKKAPDRAGEEIEPLVVPPKQAKKLLHKGHQKIYDLIRSGELESYVDADGRARNITMASIKAYIARRLDATKRGEGAKNPTAAANAARAAKRRSASVTHTPDVNIAAINGDRATSCRQRAQGRRRPTRGE
jgi:hypothetical protein